MSAQIGLVFPPYQKHSETSRAAAASWAADDLNRLQADVFTFIRDRGALGATDEEIIDGLGLNPSTARPRRIELHRLRLIESTGKRPTTTGRLAIVWRTR